MSTLDLSRLPAPLVLEPLDFEALYQEALTDFRALMGGNWSAALESDPVVKLLEKAAYDKMMGRARINDAAKALLLAFARDSDLDHLAANYNVQRLLVVPADPGAVPPIEAQYESDDSLVERTLLAFEGMSIAGPRDAYVFHAMSADGRVADARASSPSPATVEVSILSRIGEGLASEDLLEVVRQALNDEEVRPVGDRVIVQSASLIDYQVEAVLYLYPGPEIELSLTEARAALERYINTQRRLGRDIRRSAIHAALHVSRVQRVELIHPAEDVVVLDHQAANCTGSSVVLGGTDE
ncbi:baseplate assembly protein [Pseudomonas fragi]|uniref:baseplate assembly protein n=1 Tax=Pseudomonas fragi TaxID=296 RepID=UPI001F3DAD90|nr:baseplate J/gp47 family protein [Pseudomonas fragi]MCF6763998.1 baseplate J/gp47 family protein [Pseudomonas fragi]